MKIVDGGGVPCKCCGEIRWPGAPPKHPGDQYTCQRCRASCGWGHPWHAPERVAQAATRRAIKRLRPRKGAGTSDPS